MIGNHSSSDQNRYSAMRCTLYVMWWTRSANCKCQNVRPGTVSVREKAGSRKERHKGQEDFILLTRKWWRKGEKRNPLPVRVSVSQQTDQREERKNNKNFSALGESEKKDKRRQRRRRRTRMQRQREKHLLPLQILNSHTLFFSSVCLLCASPCMTQRGSEVRSAERRSVNVGSQKARKREGKELGMLMLPSKQDLRLPWDEEFSHPLSPSFCILLLHLTCFTFTWVGKNMQSEKERGAATLRTPWNFRVSLWILNSIAGRTGISAFPFYDESIANTPSTNKHSPAKIRRQQQLIRLVPSASKSSSPPLSCPSVRHWETAETNRETCTAEQDWSR